MDKTGAKRLIGVDILETFVNWANKHWKDTGRMEFIVGDAHRLKFSKESFDAVISLEMLEHVLDPVKVMGEIRRVLKKGGYAVFLVPTDNALFRVIWFLWLHFYPRGWVWRETHIRTYRNGYLPKLCKKVGFKVEENKKFNLGMLQAVKVRKV